MITGNLCKLKINDPPSQYFQTIARITNYTDFSGRKSYEYKLTCKCALITLFNLAEYSKEELIEVEESIKESLFSRFLFFIIRYLPFLTFIMRKSSFIKEIKAIRSLLKKPFCIIDINCKTCNYKLLSKQDLEVMFGIVKLGGEEALYNLIINEGLT